MRAIVSNGSEVVVTEVARPQPGKGQVLVQVKASALNRIDLVMAKGAAHGSAGGQGVPLGVEWAGEIVELGQDAGGWRVGDRVMGAGIGGFADFTLGYAPLMYSIPQDMSYEQAAALPVGLQTMHDAIATNGAFKAGQSILVQGASSGVGLSGLQIAKALGAGLVIGSSTSADRRARLKDFGADVVVDTRASDWVKQVLDVTEGNGVDLLVDMVAGPYVNGGLAATRIGGRMVNVGRIAGESGDFNFDLHSMRRINYVGVSFRTRSPVEVVEVVTRARRDLEPFISKGELRMPIDKVYRLDEISQALEHMATNSHFGKIVLSHTS
ncbi:zinc-binding dehydrogenase [Noviherbaspirillum saxi]|uniref:Quinone oxidoreductase n=1 Tax=Noviherbaspirillum saxi TaxID=2320863 RepID=A0A3A3FSZ8_9BURK|nr:zinc-binding dehydrogenase [Noviherbaspirillum saxi]RJF98640.1 quinone oxidoreductase [Noviherbaspirillum saxi]